MFAAPAKGERAEQFKNLHDFLDNTTLSLYDTVKHATHPGGRQIGPSASLGSHVKRCINSFPLYDLQPERVLIK